MDRNSALNQLAEWGNSVDILVIGGGATGLGVGVDAASRNYKTLVIEQADFGKGTSSRSTKLVHGGVRYLKQGNISLVTGALRERELLWQNAPHLVHPLEFILPTYFTFEKLYYRTGLSFYDLLAGRSGFKRSQSLNKYETLDRIPNLAPKGLVGSIAYTDGQFDDARLTICLAQTIYDHGGIALNYFKAIRFLKEQGKVSGVVVIDLESQVEYEIKARVVINATGVFTDQLRQMDEPGSPKMLTTSQGAHIVLPARFLNSTSALMVPKTKDGRVLFAIPWQDRVLVGTTDIPVLESSLEPLPLAEEIEFLLDHAGIYFNSAPTETDILSKFAGLRPLVKASAKTTSALSRDHTLLVSPSGLVTITGGKWTTYRKMAEQTVDRAVEVAKLEKRLCRTDKLKLHGWTADLSQNGWRKVYGSDAVLIEKLAASEKLHPNLPFTKSEVLWGVRYEMARKVEDILARRFRALILDAKAAIEIAPEVARLMAAELGKDANWIAAETEEFKQMAAGYI